MNMNWKDKILAVIGIASVIAWVVIYFYLFFPFLG